MLTICGSGLPNFTLSNYAFRAHNYTIYGA